MGIGGRRRETLRVGAGPHEEKNGKKINKNQVELLRPFFLRYLGGELDLLQAVKRDMRG